MPAGAVGVGVGVGGGERNGGTLGALGVALTRVTAPFVAGRAGAVVEPDGIAAPVEAIELDGRTSGDDLVTFSKWAAIPPRPTSATARITPQP